METEAEVKALPRCLDRATLFGDTHELTMTAAVLGVETSVRPRRRPGQRETQDFTFCGSIFETGLWKECPMGHLELVCPHCEKRLRLSDEHGGKTVRCPSCRNTFIAEAPKGKLTQQSQPPQRSRASSAPQQPRRTEATPPGTRQSSSRSDSGRTANRPTRREVPPSTRKRPEPVNDDAAWDESSDYEDYNDPFVPQPAASRRHRPSELPGKLLKIGLFGFLALLIIGGVGGLGYFAYRQIGASSRGVAGNAVNMAWLPENVEAVVYVRMADIVTSPFVEKARQKFPIPESMNLAGKRVEDIDYVLAGFWTAAGNPGEVPGVFNAIPFGPAGGWQQGSESLTVIRMSIAGSVPSGKQSGSYGGVTLYRDGSGKTSCLADSQTILIGSEKSVKEALDRKGIEFFQSMLSFIPSSGQVIIAGMGQTRKQPMARQLQNKPAAEIHKAIDSHTKCAAIIANFSSDVSITSTLLCHDAAGAERIDTEIKNGIAAIRHQMGQISAKLPVPELGDVLTTFMTSVNVSRDTDRLTIQARIPSGIIDVIPAEGANNSIPAPSPGQVTLGGGVSSAFDEQTDQNIYKALAYRRNAQRNLEKAGLRGAAQMKDEYDILKRGFMAQYQLSEEQIASILAKGDSLGWPNK